MNNYLHRQFETLNPSLSFSTYLVGDLYSFSEIASAHQIYQITRPSHLLTLLPQVLYSQLLAVSAYRDLWSLALTQQSAELSPAEHLHWKLSCWQKQSEGAPLRFFVDGFQTSIRDIIL